MAMWLAMLTADGRERRFDLDRARLVLGRDSRCDLRVAVPTVSLRHCEITVDGASVILRDLGSGTGTFHNGARIEQADLAAEDSVTIGPVTFVLRADAGTASSVAEIKMEQADPQFRVGERRVDQGES